MVKRIKNKIFSDEDGAQLWVQVGWSDGRVLFDTDPDAVGVDTMVSLTREQVFALLSFIHEDG